MSSSIAVIGNPVITQYLDSLEKSIPKNEVKVFNPDEKYNTLASSGSMPPVYLPSTEDRGFLMYYINASSNSIPNDSAKKMYYRSLDQSEEHWMPLDYILFTRSDGTHFLLAENISDPKNSRGLRSYSILRYSHITGRFNEDTIFSDGIDIARIRDGDQKYIDAIADGLLTEKRINESLLPVDEAARNAGSDDVTHASGYVGYVNANTLDIETSLQGNAPRLFEQEVKENQIIISDKTPLDSLVDVFRKGWFKFVQLFKSKDASSVGVIENDTTIPDEVLNKILKDAPIDEEVELDNAENSEKIELDKDEPKPEKENDEVANQTQEVEIKGVEQAKKVEISFRQLSDTLNAIEKGDVKPEKKDNDEISQ